MTPQEKRRRNAGDHRISSAFPAKPLGMQALQPPWRQKPIFSFGFLTSIPAIDDALNVLFLPSTEEEEHFASTGIESFLATDRSSSRNVHAIPSRSEGSERKAS
ncbi:MAG: hypothetical protein OEV63_16185 [Gammaproteobacteria bacterium]|nr:hypothetical protein [Gammaproteobacteria bacterium]MDH5499995.1 hypothetical protein [Gammaproteobacteria bacterium]